MKKIKDKNTRLPDQAERTTLRWIWMMDFCKAHNNPPAQKWAWDKAKGAYESWSNSGDFEGHGYNSYSTRYIT